MATPRLEITYLVEGQANAEVTVNDALNRIDAFTNISIINRTTTTPPGSPAVGDCYLIATSATGAWSGLDGQLAAWYGGGWIFCVVVAGMVVYDVGANDTRVYTGSTWNTL